MRIEELKKKIIEANIAYTFNNEPIMSNAVYDGLKLEFLAEYKKVNSKEYAGTVSLMGVKDDNQFESMAHPFPMLSLSNSFSEAELKKHFQGHGEEEYLCEYKYDGVSLELTYRPEGRLAFALTRGDGEIGEVVTANALAIANIPSHIPPQSDWTIVRGEVLMPRTMRLKLNEQRVAAGKKPFANCRNAASGSLRQKEAKNTVTRGLLFVPYSIDFSDTTDVTLGTLKGARDYLAKYFGVLRDVKCKVITGLSDVASVLEEFKEDSVLEDFDTDGVVFKLNNLEKKKLGNTGEGPRWAGAFKFPEEEVTTEVEDVVYQTGRTGQVTPVLKIVPTVIGGVTVTSATLHNFTQLRALNPQVGGKVVIKRAGEVIPYVVKCLPFEGEVRAPIEACGSCGSDLITKGELTYCTNRKTCPAQAQASLEHFVSRRCFDIDQLSGSTIAQLIDKQYVNGFADLFGLTKDKLLTLDLYSEKKAAKLLSNIDSSRTVAFSKLVHAIGIPEVGESTSVDLGHAFAGDFRALMNATREELIAIDGIGPIVSDNVLNYFQSVNKDELEALLKAVTITYVPKASGKYDGKVFCLTGSFTVPKGVIKDRIVSQGGKVSGSVSKATDFIMIGEKAGEKADKGIKLGIAQITEAELIG